MKLKKDLAISDSGFLFNPTTGDSYTTNPVGLAVLELLRQGLDMEEIVEAMQAKYEVDRDTCEKDVKDYLELLERYKLVSEE